MPEQPQNRSEKPADPAVRRRARSAAETSPGRRDKTPAPDLSGTTLGDFLLLRKLGSGGMGEVYLAQQVSLKRQVALKVLRPDMMADEVARKRFAVEAEAAAKLTHANIVQIYAFGQQNNISYMALEYVQGMNLRDYVSKKGPANPRFAVNVMEQVAAALHHAGEAGVVHRDVKPDNIMLTRRGEVKVADFGLSRIRGETPVHLTQPGVTMGTPLYMSPEQVEGKTVDPRSDLYSFGVTCYYMLSGEPPFRGETALAVAVQHLKKEPTPLEQLRPDLPPELARVVHKLMAKDLGERYQTGRQVARDLQKLRSELGKAEVEDSPVVVQPIEGIDEVEATRQTVLMKALRPDSLRRNAWWWFAATVLLAISGGAGYGWYQRAPDLRPRAGDASQRPREIAWQQMPESPSAESQYRYALAVGQFIDAEAAWMAVVHRFPTELEWVMRAKVQLGRHYLENRELDKAEKFFAEMAADLDPKTQVVGEVGQAAVVGLRGDPKRSLDMIWNAVQNSEGLGADRVLTGMVLWTIERNYRDLGTEWDRDLQRWATQRVWRQRPAQPEQRPDDAGSSPRNKVDGGRR